MFLCFLILNPPCLLLPFKSQSFQRENMKQETYTPYLFPANLKLYEILHTDKCYRRTYVINASLAGSSTLQISPILQSRWPTRNFEFINWFSALSPSTSQTCCSAAVGRYVANQGSSPNLETDAMILAGIGSEFC